MLKRHLSLIAVLLILGGLALAQTTLGNMYRLGSTTTAGRPASSSTIQGALLYDTDVAAPIYNNGSGWSVLGGGSGVFWADAGVAGKAYGTAGYYDWGNPSNLTYDGGWVPFMIASMNGTALDGGPTLALRGRDTFNCSIGTCNHPDDYTMLITNDHADPGIAFYGGSTGVDYKGAITAGATLGGQFGPSLNFIGQSTTAAEFTWLNGAGSRGMRFNMAPGGIYTLSFETASSQNAISMPGGARVDFGTGGSDYIAADGLGGIGTPGSFSSSAGAGANSFHTVTTGAFVDIGGGSQDYFVSNGTHITTPNFFSASRLNATSAGVYLTPSTTPTLAGTGHIYANINYKTDTGSVLFAYDGQNWRHLGLGKNWGAQKKEMRVEVNIESTAAHTMRSPILTSSATDVSWVCSDTGTAVTTVSNGRPYRRSTTSTSANAVSYCHTGSVAGTLETVTQTRVKPNLCAWVYTGSSVTSTRIWWGLFSSFAGTIADSPTSLHVAALRFSTNASDTNWMLVTCNGSSCTTTSTGIAVAASTNYLLCLDVADDSGVARATVNARNVAGGMAETIGTLPTSSNWVGFVHYVETLTTAARDFGLSNLSLESN